MNMFSVLLGISLGVELLGYIVTLCLIFLSNCQTVFQSGYTILYSHQQCLLLFLMSDYSQVKRRKPGVGTLLCKAASQSPSTKTCSGFCDVYTSAIGSAA